MLVEINRLNFEHYQMKFWRERNLVKGGANPGGRTRTRETSDHGRDRNCVQNGPDFNVPIATRVYAKYATRNNISDFKRDEL